MKYTIDMQGVEIELQIVDKDLGISKAKDAHIDYPELEEIANGWHSDDAKVEFSSKPYDNLGDLGSEVSSIVGKGMKTLSNTISPVAIGCTPFYEDFASGHIHTSIVDMNKKSWLEMRRKLFNAQPLIALLSLNSPVVGSLVAGDVRLMLSKWSRFADYESTSTDHWMALAYGQDGATLEVRIPPSGPIQQILGLAVLIRVILGEDTASYPIINTRENWDEIISYGSSSISRILLPTSVTYNGIKNNECLVRSTDLWKGYLEDNKDSFKKELDCLSPKLRSGVQEFFKYIADGHSLSDGIYHVYTRFKDKSKFTNFLQSMSIGTYCGASIFNYIPENPSNIYPMPEESMSLDEFRGVVDKLIAKGFKDIKCYTKDYFNAIHTDPLILQNVRIREVIDDLSRGPLDIEGVNRDIVSTLTKHGIAVISGNNLVQGPDFMAIHYTLRRAGAWT